MIGELRSGTTVVLDTSSGMMVMLADSSGIMVRLADSSGIVVRLADASGNKVRFAEASGNKVALPEASGMRVSLVKASVGKAVSLVVVVRSVVVVVNVPLSPGNASRGTVVSFNKEVVLASESGIEEVDEVSVGGAVSLEGVRVDELLMLESGMAGTVGTLLLPACSSGHCMNQFRSMVSSRGRKCQMPGGLLTGCEES